MQAVVRLMRESASERLSPLGRYTLAKYIWRFGLNDAPEGAARLSRELGLGSKAAKDGITNLIRHGVLHRASTSRGRGRPAHRYLLSSVLIARLGPQAEVRSMWMHWPLMDQVLKASGTESQLVAGFARRSGALTPANRLLLLVLLAHADQGGVVEGLRYADLERLTGLARDAVYRHLVKLKRLGFISSSTWGTASQPLSPSAPARYFLDLGHPAYANSKLASWLIPLTSDQPGKASLRGSPKITWRLIDELAALCDAPAGEEVVALPLSGRLFSFSSRVDGDVLALLARLPQASRDYLQLELERYASAMLSADPEPLRSVPEVVVVDIERQMHEKLSAPGLPWGALGPPVPEVRAELAKLLTRLSLVLADTVRGAISSLTSTVGSLTTMTVTILPTIGEADRDILRVRVTSPARTLPSPHLRPFAEGEGRPQGEWPEPEPDDVIP